MSSTAVERAARQTPAAPSASAIAEMRADSMPALLHLAIEKGLPIDQLKELVALAERVAERQARQEFATAMAAFQRECPSIKKSSTAKIQTKNGPGYTYTYAELDQIAEIVNPILARHGISYRWDETVERDTLTCVCTVSHVGGHSITASFTLPIDNASAMSPQQKVGAALTFAQRRSLSSALGLTTTDEDTDGTVRGNVDTITEDQATQIDDLLTETASDRAKFLEYVGASSVGTIRAIDYQRAMTLLQRKQQKAAR